jgi:hypothetical protein
MTLTEVLQEIHVLIEKDTDYPTASEEDYLVRLALVNSAIRIWENEEGILWNELFASLADASDGDDTTEVGVSSYDCPTDFKFPLGYLRIGTTPTFYNLMKLENIQIHDGDTSSQYWYITGNANSTYVYHINPTPTSVDTIQFEYYKTATLMEDGDDVIEMSDPQFVVYWVVGELMKEEDPGLAADYRQIALAKLRGMKTRNIMPASWQDNQIDDFYQGNDFGK